MGLLRSPLQNYRLQIPDSRSLNGIWNLESGIFLSAASKFIRFRLVDNPVFRKPNQIVGSSAKTHRHAIFLLGFRRCDVTFDHIPANFLDVALECLTVTAATR